MSNAYTADGRRRSSMTHAERGHLCSFCDRVSFGNGGNIAHARKHVRNGEAVELVKHYQTYPPMSSRLFLSPNDERISRFLAEGFVRVEAAGKRELTPAIDAVRHTTDQETP